MNVEVLERESRIERLKERCGDPRQILEVLKTNNELRGYVCDFMAWALEDSPSRTAHLVEAANRIEREVSRC